MTIWNSRAADPGEPPGRRIVRLACGSLLGACLAFLAALALLLLVPQARAVTIADDAYDFAVTSGSFTPQPVGLHGLTPPASGGKQWTYGAGRWSVNWSPVDLPDVATGNWLTSPVINPALQLGGTTGALVPIDAIRISLAHKFNFPFPGGAYPSAAGQIAYSINGGPFVGVPLAAYGTGTLASGPSPFGASPLGPYVGQQALVAPAYVPPSGAYSSLFPLLNGGASFVGSTPGYSDTGGTWVPSVATLFIAPTTVTSFQVRLINANLGQNCPADAGWDLRYLQVDFAAPEPEGYVLAAAGISGAALVRLVANRRRRRGQYR
ncbi:MAG: hypothetical protein EBZ74_03205 [Planctomycetia bacterium]|nr:hypothetical protein [Planctomycetia bacterium]